MTNVRTLTKNEARELNGGRTYYCPWGDYSNNSYWRTYGHAVAHAYRLGIFDFPLWLIKTGLGL